MEEDDSKKKQFNKYVKFSGIAFQMGGTIMIFVLAGKYLDDKLENRKLILTAIFSLVGVALSIYNLIKSVRDAQ